MATSNDNKPSPADVEPRPSTDKAELGKTFNDKANDDALAFTAEHDVGEISPEEDSRILRKIDWFLLPIVMN